jgi:structural maintenance of chromosome 2
VSVESELKKQGKAVKQLEEKRSALDSKVAHFKNEMAALDFSEELYDQLEKERSDLEPVIANLRDTVRSLTAQLQCRLSFNYTDPVRGFDRSKVKGIVARLVKVLDPKYSTALEVAAGGKLYQVVVDEAITGKALLDRGKLERRVTIIPLDKIQPRHISRSQEDRYQNTGRGVPCNRTSGLQ